MKSFTRLFVFVMVLGLSGSAVLAEEAAAPVDPAQAKKMEEIKARMNPVAQHKALEALAGNWNVASKFWMAPEGQPKESAGTSTVEVIYGGRFVKETFKGNWNGEAFEGTGYTGYDNVKGEYVANWLDSASTGIMSMAGQYNEATKTLSYAGTASCPMTGEKNKKMRMEVLLADNNQHTLVSYATTPDGKEYKSMELVYTRA